MIKIIKKDIDLNNTITCGQIFRFEVKDNKYIVILDDRVVELYEDNKYIYVESNNENNLEKIWDSFYKEDESRTRKYGGIGLGLAFVKKILLSHNSSFGAKNTNNGVLFWFSNIKQL